MNNSVFVPVRKELWLLWQLIGPIDLYWEKWKLTISAVSLEIFVFVFLQLCLLSRPPRFLCLLSKSFYLIGCGGDMKGNFLKNIKQIFSETIRWMKLKLVIHA